MDEVERQRVVWDQQGMMCRLDSWLVVLLRDSHPRGITPQLEHIKHPGDKQIKKPRCRLYLPSATNTSWNCSASVTLVHLIRMRAGSTFSGSWWNLQGRVMEPPRCVTTLPGAVCTITAPVSSSVGGRRRSKRESQHLRGNLGIKWFVGSGRLIRCAACLISADTCYQFMHFKI